MTDYELVAVVVIAVLAGAACTLLVQWASALRALTEDVRQTSRQINAIASDLRPIVARADRLTRPLEGSEADVRRVARAFHSVAQSAGQIADGASRAVALGTMLAPLISTAIERLRSGQEQESQPEQAAEGPRSPQAPAAAAE